MCNKSAIPEKCVQGMHDCACSRVLKTVSPENSSVNSRLSPSRSEKNPPPPPKFVDKSPPLQPF